MLFTSVVSEDTMCWVLFFVLRGKALKLSKDTVLSKLRDETLHPPPFIPTLSSRVFPLSSMWDHLPCFRECPLEF